MCDEQFCLILFDMSIMCSLKSYYLISMQVEKFLLKVSETGAEYMECKIQLEINDLGCWIVKFRNNGVIVNNR